MTIDFHKSFVKEAEKLKPPQKERLSQALLLFEAQPHHPDLYNHPLKGKWKGHRSIKFGGDLRAHYLPKGKNVAFFVAVGTHSQLYK